MSGLPLTADMWARIEFRRYGPLAEITTFRWPGAIERLPKLRERGIGTTAGAMLDFPSPV